MLHTRATLYICQRARFVRPRLSFAAALLVQRVSKSENCGVSKETISRVYLVPVDEMSNRPGRRIANSDPALLRRESKRLRKRLNGVPVGTPQTLLEAAHTAYAQLRPFATSS